MQELRDGEVERIGVNALGDSAVGRIGVIVNDRPGLIVGRVPRRALGFREHGAPRTAQARRPAHGVGLDVSSAMCLKMLVGLMGGGLGRGPDRKKGRIW